MGAAATLYGGLSIAVRFLNYNLVNTFSKIFFALVGSYTICAATLLFMHSCIIIIQNICVSGAMALGALIGGAMLVATGLINNSAIDAAIDAAIAAMVTKLLIQVVSKVTTNQVALYREVVSGYTGGLKDRFHCTSSYMYTNQHCSYR